MNPSCPTRRIVRWSLTRIVAALAAAAMALGHSFAAERLARDVVAFPAKDGGVYVGWRLLADDPQEIAFDVYRSDSPGAPARKLNARPITGSTNFVDAHGASGVEAALYSVRATNERAPRVAEVAVGERIEIGGVRRIKLQGDYKAQKVGLADLDGDGHLDFLIKHPDFNVDPYVLGKGYWKPSPEPYKLEAYRHDGTFLWRYDMGPGIETGIWYSPIVVYDVDGDGRAEVYCKAGPKDPAEIVRHEQGMVMGGPEFLVKLDGATGRELARIPWPSRDGIEARPTTKAADAPLQAYNYYSRNILSVAYLDGKRPHLVIDRGTYTLIKVHAYDADLKLVWAFESKGEHAAFSGQGTHGMQTADIDDDGRDEVIIGAAAIDDDGKPLWTTGRGHPDACYVGKIDPSRPGLQIYYGHEWRQNRDGLCLVDARTGETIWGYNGPTTHIHSNGLVADIDPTRPGMECYGGESNGTQFWLYDARGNRIGNRSMGGLAPRAVWWADGPTKLVAAADKLFRLKPPTAEEVAAVHDGALQANAADVVRALTQPSTPATRGGRELWAGYIGEEFGPVEGSIVAIADCLGDWREELIVSVPGEVRIYTTTIPATTRRVCLLQDRQYRTAVARQMMGYLYPPILGDGQRP